jgi:hypothetical protein
MEANADGIHDTIVLPQDGYFLLTIPGRDEDNAATGDLDIRQPVTIRPPVFFGVPGHATVDANVLDRVFDVISVPGTGVNLIGLTIKRGSYGDDAQKQGGGVNIYASKATLSFLNISAIKGAGLYIRGNFPLNPETTVSYSKIDGGNDAFLSTASAITIDDAEAVVESSVVADSQIGVFSTGTLTDLRFHNSTISGNSHYGIWANQGAQVTISHSTIADNGISGLNIIDMDSVIDVSHSVFASNDLNCKAQDGGVFVMDDNLYDDDSCPADGVNDDSLFNTPAFLSLLGDHGGPTPTHRPMTNSPALDFIAEADCADAEFDQRLMPRPIAFANGEARCDLGAVELETDVIFFDQFDRL